MARENDDLSAATDATQRFVEFLEFLSQQGYKQSQIAAKVGLPAQYISDIKCGRRPLTELVARRLGEQFDVGYEWLMGSSASMDSPRSKAAVMPGGSGAWLPLFSDPIEGEPNKHPKWSGAGIEVTGVAAAKLPMTTLPYILKYGRNDREGRLKQGDFVLISQARFEDAEFQVVRYRRMSVLARAGENGGWIVAADGRELPSNSRVIGHCVGIVWAPLL
jgi:transcriptional regulator with XRE-family HTH domain